MAAHATAIIDVAGAPRGIVEGDVQITVDGALITARIGHFDRVDIEMTLVQAGALVKLLAEIERRINQENARPKKRYISPATREEVYAMYYDALRRKIEERGTRNFPEYQGKKLYGELTMNVTVDAAGRGGAARGAAGRAGWAGARGWVVPGSADAAGE